MKTLRQRIRRDKIKCIPWSIWKSEIDLMPISSKALFARSGVPIDILERELQDEGWLYGGEILLEILKSETNLRRLMLYEINDEPWDSTWDENDYREYYNRLGKIP